MSVSDHINEADSCCQRIDDIGPIQDTLMSIIEALKEMSTEIESLKKSQIDP